MNRYSDQELLDLLNAQLDKISDIVSLHRSRVHDTANTLNTVATLIGSVACELTQRRHEQDAAERLLKQRQEVF